MVEYHEYATWEDGAKVRTGREEKLTSISLANSCVLKPHSQTHVLVTTRLKGPIITEPKSALATKFGVRAMKNVNEVLEDRPFTILMSNFSGKARRFPKGMIVAYASRSPIAYVSLTSGVAHELGAAYDLFPSTVNEPVAYVNSNSYSDGDALDPSLDPEYLTDHDLLLLLRDDHPVMPSSTPDAPVLPETQTMELTQVTDIPQPEGADVASGTTP